MYMRFGILTVSDTRSEAEDHSGNILKELVSSFPKNEVTLHEVVQDDIELIKGKMEEWIDNGKVDVVLTTGGTGCSPRDVTPEATKLVIEKELNSMMVAMTIKSIKSTPYAMLSRSICGTRKESVIVNLPGSPSGAKECVSVVLPVLSHVVDLLKKNNKNVKITHGEFHEFEGFKKKIHLTSLVHQKVYESKNGEEMVEPEPEEHHKLTPHNHAHLCRKRNHHRRISTNEPSLVDETHVALRPRFSNFPAIEVDEALGIILKETHFLPPESVAYDQCLDRIVAEDLYSECDLPPFHTSIKDGYALIASDGVGNRQVVGNSIAGSFPPIVLEKGQCCRISTGAPLPPGADAVIQVEDTKLIRASRDGTLEEEVEICVQAFQGLDIRQKGNDIKEGEIILKKGSKVSSADIGLLASVGSMSLTCYKLPLVGVMSTGNELIEPESRLKEGNIRDSNRPMLLSILKEQRLLPVDLGKVVDKADSLLNNFKIALETVDIIITTGGVSMGEKDLVKEVLEKDLEAKIHFGRIFMKPGKPTTFATLEYKNKKKYVFGLPGNPVSALVTFHLFVLPSLRKMQGQINPENTVIKARIKNNLKLDQRPEYHRCSLSWKDSPDGIPYAESTGNQLSSRLLSMSSAVGLLKLPTATVSPEDRFQSILEKNAVVDFILFSKID